MRGTTRKAFCCGRPLKRSGTWDYVCRDCGRRWDEVVPNFLIGEATWELNERKAS